jgi:hypothetical protein
MTERSLSDVVKDGDHLESLIALRDHLAKELDGFSKQSAAARDVAAISGRLVDVLERISLIVPPEKSKVDELAERRDKRRSSVRGPDPTNPAQSGGAN